VLESTDALQLERACAFSTARDARRDEPSIRCGSIERCERMVCCPLPNPRSQHSKTASVIDAARGVVCRELRKYVFAAIAVQMKEKKRCKGGFLLHRFPTAFITGFPHLSYGFFEILRFIGLLVNGGMCV
jgi:hypothetical protein